MRRGGNLNMIKCFEYLLIILFLFAGSLMLLHRIEFISGLKKALLKAKVSLDEQDRQGRILYRKNLSEFEKSSSFWIRLDRQLEYSGLKRRFPKASPGRFLVLNLVIPAALFWILTVLTGIRAGIISVIVFYAAEVITIGYLKAKNLRIVDEELPKFLDFLGNYSLTSGELISIFSQIGKYLKEPLRGVLEECEAESKVTGDMRMALLSMADKIEHPQFKQLVRNLEITARYSADFEELVADSRRGMREYLSQNRDRKGMLREAAINMGLLIIMSVIVLLVVNMLIGGGIGAIILNTFVGHIAVGAVSFIMILFISQVLSMNK